MKWLRPHAASLEIAWILRETCLEYTRNIIIFCMNRNADCTLCLIYSLIMFILDLKLSLTDLLFVYHWVDIVFLLLQICFFLMIFACLIWCLTSTVNS